MGMDRIGQQVNDPGTAGVIARPPLLFLAALLLGLASDRLLPWPFVVPGTDPVYWISAGSMILVGLALAAAGIRNFSRAGTPVPTNEPTRALVTQPASTAGPAIPSISACFSCMEASASPREARGS